MRVHLALKHGKKASAYNKTTLTEEQVEEATRELIEIENNKHIQERLCSGDASETGLIKFCQSIMGVEETRKEYPIFAWA